MKPRTSRRTGGNERNVKVEKTIFAPILNPPHVYCGVDADEEDDIVVSGRAFPSQAITCLM